MAMASTCLGSSICRTKTTYLAGLVRCSATPQLTQEPSRRSANYQPNSWDYDSLESLKSGSLKEELLASDFRKLKSEVRELMFKEAEPSSRLQFVDVLQRLGIAYQFEDEIKQTLGSIFLEHSNGKLSFKDDVLSMSLLFRLLRENGFSVSPEFFRSLKDDKGNFKTSIGKDIKGLLSLYESSFLAYGGEPILDDARSFAAKCLKELKPAMDPYLRSRVDHTLDLPLHWRAPRVENRWSIDHYATDDGSMKAAVMRLAQLDFNNVQSVHQEELTRMTRWWKNVALGEKFSFARDRLIECFYYATGVVYDPHLGAARETITQIFSLILHLDDVYDVYGTLEELTLFTDAIARWEMSAMDTLPEYMHPIYATILKTSNDMAAQILREQGCDAHSLFKKAWHDLCKAFLNEAKWHYGGYMPGLEEYLNNGWMSSSGPLMLLHAFPFLKEQVNPKILTQLESYPRLVRASSKIFRLCNDSATHSAELERGDAPSSIAIYMREKNANEQVSREAMRDLTIETWKEINEDAFDRRPFPRSFANACMNLGRISHCIYQGGDGLGAPDEKKKKQIKALFLEPVVVAGGEKS